ARISPIRRNGFSPCAGRSAPRTAKPSIAEFAKPGTSNGATTSTASTRPSTSSTATLSAASRHAAPASPTRRPPAPMPSPIGNGGTSGMLRLPLAEVVDAVEVGQFGGAVGKVDVDGAEFVLPAPDRRIAPQCVARRRDGAAPVQREQRLAPAAVVQHG